MTAIIGPNGAGKSTLLSLVGRLIAADAGTVHVDGLDVTRVPSAELARRLAILRQENVVVPRLTVRELVAFGRFPHTRGRPNADDRDRVDAALAQVGLDRHGHRFLDELSGGQRQRAFIAMVLCQDTRYLLLDEPLNSLDMQHAVGVMRVLRRAADVLGRTIVVVLHDLNAAAGFADRIVAMRDGRIAMDGPVERVVRSDVLGRLFEAPIQVEVVGGRPFVAVDVRGDAWFAARFAARSGGP